MFQTSSQAIEAILALPFVIMGLSHLVQPAMWRDFFTRLHGLGPTGVIWRCFALELWPAAAIVAFHQDWHWPGILLTLYGHALMAKCALGLLMPQLGLRSLAMAERHGDRGFRIAGAVLLLLGLFCFWRIMSVGPETVSA